LLLAVRAVIIPAAPPPMIRIFFTYVSPTKTDIKSKQTTYNCIILY